MVCLRRHCFVSSRHTHILHLALPEHAPAQALELSVVTTPPCLRSGPK
jgi:hypothetical protein